MKKYNDAKCGVIVNGHRCNQPPAIHGVERRHVWSPKPVAHSFVNALPSQRTESDNANG